VRNLTVPKEHLIDIAQKYIKKGQHKKAIKEYQKALEKDPKNIRVRLKLGDLYLKNGHKDKAIGEYMRVAQQYENDDLNFRATAIYKKVLYLNPGLVDVYHKLANLYLRENLIGNARLQYHNILKIHPNDPVALEALEKIERNRTRADTPSREGPILEPPPLREAPILEPTPIEEQSGPRPTLPTREEGANEIPILTPSEIGQEPEDKDLEMHYHLGIAYKEMELIDHAIGEFETASANEGRRFDCLVMLGMCFMEKEEYDKAIGYFNNASHVKELNKEEMVKLQYRLGVAYENNGMNQEALKAYDQIIDLDSKFLDVRSRIERLKQPS
jgi:tetratricopeptide (TPR) repeat protein